MKVILLICSMVLAFETMCMGQNVTPPYKNPELPTDVRVKDLLSRMTPEEKFWQMFMIPGDLSIGKEKYKHGIFGFQTEASGQSNAATQLLNYEAGSSAKETAKKINEIQRYFIEETRLGIPIIAFDEALHGLIRSGATAFPQSIGMAASWNTDLMREVSSAIAIETKSRGIRDILSPVVNLANDVRWGRTEETYGEDPFLSAEMGVAFVSEFEKIGVITSPKHFIANVADGGRDSYPVYFNERHIREYYLPPFLACFKEGGSRSVMTSYNSLDGMSCTANEWLLRKVLKEEIGFDGFVISDAGAVGGSNVLHFTAKDYPGSTKLSIEGGLDVMFQTDYNHYTLFKEAFDKGMIDPMYIDDAVTRILKAKFDLGLFENPYVDPEMADKVNNSEKHREIARRMACESMVLLKNDNNTLPIKECKSIALIGEDAIAARLGGYSGPGVNKVSIHDGLKNAFGESVKIKYTKGGGASHSEYVVVPSEYLSCQENGETKSGLFAKYYDNSDFQGEPTVSGINGSINFGWTLFSPNEEKIPYDCYSIVWTGKIKSPISGKFDIGARGNDGYRIYIDGKLIVDNWKKVSFGTHTAPFIWVKDKEYDIRVEYYETAGNARFALIWNMGVDADGWKQEVKKAASLAAASDVAVVVVGLHEGEFSDRALLSLQGKQEETILAVAETGKPVVVLIVGGSAVTMDKWKDKVDAIVQVWYPGVEGGNAVADVITGKYSPSGKLPITFPMHEGQLPLVYNHKPTGRGDDYNNLSGQPLFPFGYGLSYSNFEYSNIKIFDKEIGVNGSTKVSCKVKNTGEYTADEVVQLYIKDMFASLSQPIIQLKGFKKISLAPGEEKEVVFDITPQMLKMLDKNMKWVVEPGEFRIMIGASCKDIRVRDNLIVVE